MKPADPAPSRGKRRSSWPWPLTSSGYGPIGRLVDPYVYASPRLGERPECREWCFTFAGPDQGSWSVGSYLARRGAGVPAAGRSRWGDRDEAAVYHRWWTWARMRW